MTTVTFSGTLEELAAHIATKIFDNGRDRGERPTRLEYKRGPVDPVIRAEEKTMGGLVEYALTNLLIDILQKKDLP